MIQCPSINTRGLCLNHCSSLKRAIYLLSLCPPTNTGSQCHSSNDLTTVALASHMCGSRCEHGSSHLPCPLVDPRVSPAPRISASFPLTVPFRANLRAHRYSFALMVSPLCLPQRRFPSNCEHESPVPFWAYLK